MVLGKPSASLADNLEKAEKARIIDQIEKLGPEGLKEAERKLEAAKAEHSKPIPSGILTSFPVPDVKSIAWIPVQSVQEPGKGRKPNPHGVSTNGDLQNHIESDGNALPFFVEYDHVEVCILYSLNYRFLPCFCVSQTLLPSVHSSRWLSSPITFDLICLPMFLLSSLCLLSDTME